MMTEVKVRKHCNTDRTCVWIAKGECVEKKKKTHLVTFLKSIFILRMNFSCYFTSGIVLLPPTFTEMRPCISLGLW